MTSYRDPHSVVKPTHVTLPLLTTSGCFNFSLCILFYREELSLAGLIIDVESKRERVRGVGFRPHYLDLSPVLQMPCTGISPYRSVAFI